MTSSASSTLAPPLSPESNHYHPVFRPVLLFYLLISAFVMGSLEKDPATFAIPREDTPMDMSLSENERIRRAAFFKKVEEMKASMQVVMSCSKCLLIFSDAILYRIHMSMHGIGPSPSATWQCSMCHRQYADRRQFQLHTIRYSHSLIPQGVVIPPSINFNCGLPDLAGMCQQTEVLDKIVELMKKKQ